MVAAVLSAVFTGTASAMERVRSGVAGWAVMPVDGESLVSGLSDRARKLARSAGRWPTVIAAASAGRW